MDKIATRINILETELKFAWSALDLLSSEYGKMWTRLEKLENISMEQKSVVANLMGLYGATSMSATANFPTAADFTDMMGELRNEALGHGGGAFDTVDGNAAAYATAQPPMNLDGGLTANRISADIRHLQEQQKQIEQNIQHNERLFDELNALSYTQNTGHASNQSMLDAKMAHASNSQSLREFLASGCIKDGLEEGIDLVQRERLKQQYSDQNAAHMQMYRNLMQNESQQKRTDAEFFRSGEINRDLYSNQIEATAPNIYEDLVRLELEQQKNKLLSIGSDGNIIEIILAADNMYEPQAAAAAAAAAAIISRPASSLGMIYEDNEEQDAEHQSSASEVDELRLYADDPTKDTLLSPSKKDAMGHSSRKSKKKKSHRKLDADSIQSFLGGSEKTERPVSPVKMSKEETITFILDEISKIEDLSLFTSEQFNSMKELIANEFTFFNKINQNNKHLLLILLNPISASDTYESTQQKCDTIMQKLRKNMGILHTMLDTKNDLSDIKPNEAIDIDEILETSSSILDDDSRSEKRVSSSDLPKMLGKRYDPVVTKNENCYSQNLLRNNFSLNEQLKLLDSRESEIICKKSIKSITEELEASERKNLLDNFDENAIISGAHRTQSLSHFPAIRNDSYQYESNSSIYSNDEYIKSLKKSLERHNSMLFLLHLQNSNYQSSNDIRSDAKDAAVPPAGINKFDIFQN